MLLLATACGDISGSKSTEIYPGSWIFQMLGEENRNATVWLHKRELKKIEIENLTILY